MRDAAQPNVLLIVLDACRFDHAQEHAPTLRRLGEDGLWFRNAIAPATWTQPSHASIFTGEYPHRHGVTQPSQQRAPTDLVDRFSDRGYATHGASGNGFVSPLWEFDRAFDTFRYTQTPEPFPTGKDTYTFLRNRVGAQSNVTITGSVIRACLGHDQPTKSIVNLASVGVNAAVRRVAPQLTRISQQPLVPNPQYAYAPDKNTRLIERAIRREAERDRPFFVFANYMDTHRPYQAPAKIQSRYLEGELSPSEFRRLNEDVAAPWEFVRLVEEDSVDESDVRTLGELYSASVASVDQHLASIEGALVDAGIREDTVLVVVGDHGENLGETDAMGRRRFGHEASMSRKLAHVPLAVSHPSLSGDVDDLVSVKDLYQFLLEISDPAVSISDLDSRDLTSERVLCEYPALADEGFYERYPEIRKETLRHRVETDSVAAYEGDWRIVMESDGATFAERNGSPVSTEDVPVHLREFTDQALDELGELQRTGASAAVASRLEDLGYM